MGGDVPIGMCSCGGRRSGSGRLGFNLTCQQRIDGVEPLVELLLVGRLHEEAAVLGGDAERALGQGLQTIAIIFLVAVINRPR